MITNFKIMMIYIPASLTLLVPGGVDPSTPSMRKDRDRGEKREKKEKTDDYSGHYVIASSRPPEQLRPYDER